MSILNDMKKVLFYFLGMLFLGITLFSSCSPSKMLWFTSSGVMTYNRNTGQFEVLWENNGQGNAVKCDTVYIYVNNESNIGSVR